MTFPMTERLDNIVLFFPALTTAMHFLLGFLKPHSTNCSVCKILLLGSWLVSGEIKTSLQHWSPCTGSQSGSTLILKSLALHIKYKAPQYLSTHLTLYNPKCHLHSSKAGLLTAPCKTRLRSVGDRAFSFYAHTLEFEMYKI